MPKWRWHRELDEEPQRFFMNYLNHQEDQLKAAWWAAGVLADRDALILDTETTGLDQRAQVIQLAILDTSSDVKMDRLLKPTVSIECDAERVHGLTMEMVEDAPTIVDVYEELTELLMGASRVVIYNASYDVRLINQSFAAYKHPWSIGSAFVRDKIECAMLRYAEWFGEWMGRSTGSPTGSYRWQKLPGGDHTALGDCRATLGVLWKMAASLPTVSLPAGSVYSSASLAALGPGPGMETTRPVWVEIEDGA